VGYNPSHRHVLHGLDADLIMLGLATHEVHFFVLREEVVFGRRGQEQIDAAKERSGHAEAQRRLDEQDRALSPNCINAAYKPLQILSLSTLREYLKFEFKECEAVPFKPNFERLIDDIVFLCFFVGNDFLPHLPSLDIRDGALDYLFNVYKRLLPTLGDYITSDGGNVCLQYVDIILAEVGKIEDYVFSMRHQQEVQDEKRRESFKKRIKASEDRLLQNAENGKGVQPNKEVFAGMGKAGKLLDKNDAGVAVPINVVKSTLSSSSTVVSSSTTVTSVSSVTAVSSSTPNATTSSVELSEEENEAAKKRMKEEFDKRQRAALDEHSKNVVDNVKLHEAGWKDRYYTDKCKAEDIVGRGGKEHLFKSYVVGLCWVMKYYYQGVASWKWFYPFHYAPFASDLRNIERFQDDVKFELHEAFSPVEQMMGVFPGDTAHAVPKACRYLLTDDDSPIIDFYPKDVPTDPNGKAMPWLWVVLLPFIDEDRLVAAMKPTIKDWTAKEKLQNMRGLLDGWIYVHAEHPLASTIEPVALCSKLGKDGFERRDLGDAAKWGGFTGSVIPPLKAHQVLVDKKTDIPRPKNAGVDSLLRDGISKNMALCCAFEEPERRPHLSVILPGAVEADPVLEDHDLVIRRPRLNHGGGSISEMGGSNQGGHVKGTTFEPQRVMKRQRMDGGGGANGHGNNGQFMYGSAGGGMNMQGYVGAQHMVPMQQPPHMQANGGMQWQVAWQGQQGQGQQMQQQQQHGVQWQQQFQAPPPQMMGFPGQFQAPPPPPPQFQQGMYGRPPPPPPPTMPVQYQQQQYQHQHQQQYQQQQYQQHQHQQAPQFARPPQQQGVSFSFNKGGGSATNGGGGSGRAQPPKNATSNVMMSLKDQLRATLAGNKK
jgi:5'-3' exoribonuclease 2